MARAPGRNARPSSTRRRLTAGDRMTESVIDDLGAFAPPPAVLRVVAERCLRVGVEPPSSRSIRARLAHRRGLARSLDADGMRLVVDHCPLDLPLAYGCAGGTVLPVASLAMVDPGGTIVASSLRVGRPTPEDTARLLAAAAARLTGSMPLVVRAAATCPGDWPAIDALLARVGRPGATSKRTERPLGSEARRLIGRTLSGIPLRSRSWRRTIVPQGCSASPVHDPEVMATFDEAVARHNEGRTDPCALALALPSEGEELVAALLAIAEGHG